MIGLRSLAVATVLLFVLNIQASTFSTIDQSIVPTIHNIVKREWNKDVIDFTPKCTLALAQINQRCLKHMIGLLEMWKTSEKGAVSSWADQCDANKFDCISSPDTQMGPLLDFFKQMLPTVKNLCTDNCMLPIIDLVHACVDTDTMASLDISRGDMEEILDLVCIQESPSEGGEYCIIKAMETAYYLFEANQIQNCNTDTIDLANCDNCVCPKNCSTLMKAGSSLMGCCMGTVLYLEETYKWAHYGDKSMMNPGSKLFNLCNVTTAEKCMTSADTIKNQTKTYDECKASLEDSLCVKLSSKLHQDYLADIQNISRTCNQSKNLGVCAQPNAQVVISSTLTETLHTINAECDECRSELMGITDKCSVFLSDEAKMVLSMTCLKSSDAQHCGPKVIVYEAERERQNLNSNPCFQNMPNVQNQCTLECAAEVNSMNNYRVLACFDALIEHYHLTPKQEWAVFHKNCIVDTNVVIKDKLDYTYVVTQRNDSMQAATGGGGNTVAIIGYTFISTVLLALVFAAIAFGVYKRHRVAQMFGYDNLIADVQMEENFD